MVLGVDTRDSALGAKPGASGATCRAEVGRKRPRWLTFASGGAEDLVMAGEDEFAKALRGADPGSSWQTKVATSPVFVGLAAILYALGTHSFGFMAAGLMITGIGFIAMGSVLIAQGQGWKTARARGLAGLAGAKRRVHPAMLNIGGVVLLPLGLMLLL